MPDLFLGLDIGTSGARAIVIDGAGTMRANGRAAMADFGTNYRAPDTWWQAALAATQAALNQVDARDIRALAVDGTSGSMLAVDDGLVPLGDSLMYNDACRDQRLLDHIADSAPADSAALGANSALARAILLARKHRPARVLHQADWIASQFSGTALSDENNALKTGYDLRTGSWPEWIAQTELDPALLPDVRIPGTGMGPIGQRAQKMFGFGPNTVVVAGTTDGCASFVATGADQPGQAVTALGTTMTLKILSDKAISAPEYGIYSHRILGQWLAGGASNTGGKVLLKYFSSDKIAQLSQRIDPETDSPLDYYPLTEPGERFPIADPAFPPRLDPRPADDAAFLKGLFAGIAQVEKMAYDRLHELGGPNLGSVRTVGGGAQNMVWTRLRARRLGVPLVTPSSTEAAYGTALLAQRGVS